MIVNERPVIIAHFSTNPSYLRMALKSAAEFNNNVVLIGDHNNKKAWKKHWEVFPEKLDKFQEFLKYYKHMSSFSYDYEVSCFKRMFAMEQWMKEEKVSGAFHLDSDIMSFANYTNEICTKLPSDCKVTLMAVENEMLDYVWVNSCHFSYWTIEALENYTNYCIEVYKKNDLRKKLEEKWKWHVDNHKGGGICDMTVLFLWSKNYPSIQYMTKIWSGVTADHNFNQSSQFYDNEYLMSFGLKKFHFIKGLPYGTNLRTNQRIRFLCIHCQGAGKCTMSFLGNKLLRPYYVMPRIFHRIKSKYLRFSFRKFNKLFNSNGK